MGWESCAQVRPPPVHRTRRSRTRSPARTYAGLATDEELAGFQSTMLSFEGQCWQVAMQVLSCFAWKLGFDEASLPARTTLRRPAQSTLRLLHYFATPPEQQAHQPGAGAHTDFDCLTCSSSARARAACRCARARRWTPRRGPRWSLTSRPSPGNIGDMLMRWSDDQLPSNFPP